MKNERLFNLCLYGKRMLCRFIGDGKVSINKKRGRNDRYKVFDLKTFYTIHFCTRTAAIMWLKRYGKEDRTYMLYTNLLISAQVRVWNGYVYFYDPDYGLGDSAESKRTCQFAVRNN